MTDSVYETGRGAWSILVLIRRHLAVVTAERRNLLLLAGQPLVIALLISLVAPDEKTVPRKIFLGQIAVLWLACSNAAQVIVRERAIFLRERLAGLGVHRYLLSKFISMSVVSCLQAGLLFSLLWISGPMFGSVPWQAAALAAGALAMTAVGLLISSWAKHEAQAVLLVPVVIIPQILLAGFVFTMDDWRNGRQAAAVLSVIGPSACTQRLSDIGLLWEQRLDFSSEDNIFDKYSLRDPCLTNLEHALVPLQAWLEGEVDLSFPVEQQESWYAREADPAGLPLDNLTVQWPESRPSYEPGRIFRHSRAAVWPLAVLGGWVICSYALAALILRRAGR